MADTRRGRLLGTVTRLQVQRAPLKQGPARARAYDPSHILGVQALRVDSDGVVGLADDADDVVDVHHAKHPRTRDPRGDRGLSLMAQEDYRWLRERFGDHLSDGVAGENLTLRCDAPLRGRDLSGGAVIETRDGPLPLTDVRVAAPCVEFTRFVLRRPAGSAVDDITRTTLESLGEGARGFVSVATLDATVSIGDRVYALQDPSR